MVRRLPNKRRLSAFSFRPNPKKKELANFSERREIFQPPLWQQNPIFLARLGDIFPSSVIF